MYQLIIKLKAIKYQNYFFTIDFSKLSIKSSLLKIRLNCIFKLNLQFLIFLDIY